MPMTFLSILGSLIWHVGSSALFYQDVEQFPSAGCTFLWHEHKIEPQELQCNITGPPVCMLREAASTRSNMSFNIFLSGSHMDKWSSSSLESVCTSARWVSSDLHQTVLVPCNAAVKQHEYFQACKLEATRAWTLGRSLACNCLCVFFLDILTTYRDTVQFVTRFTWLDYLVEGHSFPLPTAWPAVRTGNVCIIRLTYKTDILGKWNAVESSGLESLPGRGADLPCWLSGGRLCKNSLTRLTPVLKPSADFSPVTLLSRADCDASFGGSTSCFETKEVCGEVLGLVAGDMAGFSSPSKNNCRQGDNGWRKILSTWKTCSNEMQHIHLKANLQKLSWPNQHSLRKHARILEF